MKAFLMATQQQSSFTEDLFAILGSRYEGFNMQTASNNNEMTFMLKNDTYDLAIVNSDKDALALSTEIIASGLLMPILVYTETNHIPFIKQLYGLGVSGVLNVAANNDELLKAVADVLAKRIYISESLKQDLLQSAQTMTDNEDVEYPKSSFFDDSAINAPLTFVRGCITFYTICLN